MSQHTQQFATFDSMLEALDSRTRRQLLVNLLEDDPLEESKQAATIESDVPRDRFRTRFRHAELPKLDDLGYVDWNRETGRIERGPAFEAIRPLLELLVRNAAGLPADWL